MMDLFAPTMVGFNALEIGLIAFAGVYLWARFRKA